MQVSVLVEPIKGNGYRASAPRPFNISSQGSTRDEALDKLRTRIQAILKNGTELVAMDIGPETHPLAEFAGMFKDDPYFKDVLKIMAQNRRQTNENSKVP